jgi:hypothetical protein
LAEEEYVKDEIIELSFTARRMLFFFYALQFEVCHMRTVAAAI